MNQKKLEGQFEDINMGKLMFLKSTTSTNEIAARWVMDGVPNYSLVAADEQTRGRGRSGRSWYTYPGTALAFSLIIYPEVGPDYSSRFTGLGALAVLDAISSLGAKQVEIKWPNDILIQREKVCGILSEAVWYGNQLKAIILGIGVNITIESLPATSQLNFPATYLEAHTKAPVDRLTLLQQIITLIQRWEKVIDTDEFISRWNRHLAFLGMNVQIIMASPAGGYENQHPKSAAGIIQGISSSGELLIQHADGKIAAYNANEIHISPHNDS